MTSVLAEDVVSGTCLITLLRKDSKNRSYKQEMIFKFTSWCCRITVNNVNVNKQTLHIVENYIDMFSHHVL